MENKQSYRNGKSEDCKRRMLAALEEHMDALTEELGDLSKDADCREERETISRYIEKLRKMMWVKAAGKPAAFALNMGTP